MWNIIHVYDEDGGFGDAVEVMEVIGAVPTKEMADEYIAKWSNPFVYDKPYAELWCHKLIAREIKIIDINNNPFADDYFEMERKRYEEFKNWKKEHKED